MTRRSGFLRLVCEAMLEIDFLHAQSMTKSRDPVLCLGTNSDAQAKYGPISAAQITFGEAHQSCVPYMTHALLILRKPRDLSVG